VIWAKRRSDIFGIGPVGAVGESNHVHEEHRDDLALFAGRDGSRLKLRAADAAEAETIWVVLAALGADHGTESSDLPNAYRRDMTPTTMRVLVGLVSEGRHGRYPHAWSRPASSL